MENFQNQFEKASMKLTEATSNYKLWFHKILVVVPEKWKSCGSYATDPIAYTRVMIPSFIVGASHALFGDNPWTQQPRQCGLQGDFIYMPEKFLNNDSDESGNCFLSLASLIYFFINLNLYFL